MRLNPVFDWEDEGDLFDPNCLIDADLDAATPDEQTGEKARLRLLDATWSGQGADYNPLAEPTTADVEIKDGAIAELYFDYDGDGTLDPYQSTADETCYVPINDDDDNENDLRQFVAVAWLAHYGNPTLEASVTVGGNSGVKFGTAYTNLPNDDKVSTGVTEIAILDVEKSTALAGGLEEFIAAINVNPNQEEKYGKVFPKTGYLAEEVTKLTSGVKYGAPSGDIFTEDYKAFFRENYKLFARQSVDMILRYSVTPTTTSTKTIS